MSIRIVHGSSIPPFPRVPLDGEVVEAFDGLRKGERGDWRAERSGGEGDCSRRSKSLKEGRGEKIIKR